jgi:hypothetical protein
MDTWVGEALGARGTPEKMSGKVLTSMYHKE